MPPSASATPRTTNADPANIPRRPSFRRSVRESGLPEDYLEALEAKRRQLDDSIWKYIASKEREYKTYEKELRHQRRASQGQEGSGEANGVSPGRKRRDSPREAVEENGDEGKVRKGAVELPESATAVLARVDGVESKDRERERETMDRSSIAGLKDRRASLERDKDFAGIFTPSYLPALSDDHTPHDAPGHLERTSSTPEQLLTGSAPSSAQLSKSPGSLERTSSDSIVHAKKATRPSQLVLQHRTSSSGSSADSRLASAMKSPTQRPKRKRVSLAVGDAIVAPSDNVPGSLSAGRPGTPSHSRIRQAVPAQPQPQAQSVALPVSMQSNSETTGMSAQTTAVSQAILQAEEAAMANARNLSASQSQEAVLSPPMVDKNDFAPNPGTRLPQSRIDPDGDLFDLEGEDDTELPPPILDSDEGSDDAEEDTIITGRLETPSSSAATNPIFTPPSTSHAERYDATTGLIPEPEDGKPDTAVPYLPSSVPTAQQPLKPGFRRPSVVHDPVFPGAGYAAAETEAVEDEVYGSSYARPGKGSFVSVGSVGESFMERNAEEMALRREREKGGREGKERAAQVRG